jgi:fumarate reductase subunit D
MSPITRKAVILSSIQRDNTIGKLILLGAVALPAWHATNRLRMTAHDLGLGGGVGIKAACYGTDWLLILAAAGASMMI